MSAEPVHVHCLSCQRYQNALDAMELDMANLEVELKGKRRQVKALEKELADRRRTDPHYDTAVRIFDYWRAKCAPNARTFSEDRLKAVLARLRDRDPDDKTKHAYPPRYLCEAIVGAAVDPYVDEKGKAHIDLELICRTGKKLEDFHSRYERWKARTQREAAKNGACP
jgi:hypothetical protein